VLVAPTHDEDHWSPLAEKVLGNPFVDRVTLFAGRAHKHPRLAGRDPHVSGKGIAETDARFGEMQDMYGPVSAVPALLLNSSSLADWNELDPV
jgi:hypothetical protein